MSMQDRGERFAPRGGLPHRGGPPQVHDRLPEGYLANGYFDTSGNIMPQVVVDWPRAIASSLAGAGLQTAQLRKFFGEARHIEGQLHAGADFAALQGRILKLDGYAADAVKKGNAPPLFKQFIQQNLRWASRDEKSFLQGFIEHFESVVGYFPKK